MKEQRTTILFITAALVVVLLTWFTRPTTKFGAVEADLGAELFPEFHDPLTARSIEITQFDEATGTPERFEVAKTGDDWTIPSHSNYPADAEKQLGNAAASVIDIKKLKVVSTSPADHATFGVIDPDPKNLTIGTTGVGKKVVLKNAQGRVLAAFIIGKAPEDRPGIRYIRIPGEDPVYMAEMNTTALSTRFGDWIEKDLLMLKGFDIERVTTNDYSVDELQGTIEQRGRYTVGYDSRESKWVLDSMETYGKDGWTKQSMPEGEELNTQKLNDLKVALDDLKIVDVVRKPAGLSATLRVGEELAGNRETQLELAQRGFFVAKLGDSVQLISNEGDVHVGTLEGVEYILRFGEVTRRGGKEDEEEKKDDQDKTKGEDAADAEGGGQNRYILVTAQFNPDLIAKPDLAVLPEEKPAEDKKPDDEKKSDGEPDSDDAKKPDETKEPAATPKKPDPMRAAIEKENQRKQDEYDAKVKAGQEKVQRLNDRFADWYYVISDATYRKIHLPQAELLKKKSAEGQADGDQKSATNPASDSVEEFDKLQKQGLPQ